MNAQQILTLVLWAAVFGVFVILVTRFGGNLARRVRL